MCHEKDVKYSMMQARNPRKLRHAGRIHALWCLLFLFVGGLSCPCEGGLQLIASAFAKPSAHDARACCRCCHEEEDAPVKTPERCACLSGCCSLYLLPSHEEPSFTVASWLPVDVSPLAGHLSQTNTEQVGPTSFAIDPLRLPGSVLLSQLCSLLI
jgi:hypothetical protein